jgi:hypothetical protein
MGRRSAARLRGGARAVAAGTHAGRELDFAGFLAEVRKAFRREIPVRQRDDWEEWLAAQRSEHKQRTAEIVRLETQLNRRVYDLFDLTAAEVKVIEESTKYRYGEVRASAGIGTQRREEPRRTQRVAPRVGVFAFFVSLRTFVFRIPRTTAG